VAELVVDITTTGATLQANGLKILNDGVILRSQAQLVASLGAVWSPEALLALRSLLDAFARTAGKANETYDQFVRALNDTRP
jgi:ATP phosphoribosyltransferase